MPSTVTCRSSMASRRADWVLGEARLISSPRTMLAKIGPGRNSKMSRPRFHTVTPDDVGGQQVGGELHPLPVGVDRRRQGLGQARLAHPGHVLDEQMALGEQAHEREFHHLGLALDDDLDVGRDGVEQLGERRSGRVARRLRRHKTHRVEPKDRPALSGMGLPCRVGPATTLVGSGGDRRTGWCFGGSSCGSAHSPRCSWCPPWPSWGCPPAWRRRRRPRSTPSRPVASWTLAPASAPPRHRSEQARPGRCRWSVRPASRPTRWPWR